jgi:Uma2 family endonuclease
MAEPAHAPLIDVDTYLQGELTSELRREYIAGQVYAMGGTSDAHNLIALNFATRLHRHLRGGPCQVFMSDMKVRLRLSGEHIFYYPDLLVSCRADDRARYWREQPCLIVEITSRSTDRIDRREKLLAYREIAALEEYLLVDQATPRLTLLRRTDAWQPLVLTGSATLQLTSVALELPVMDLYEGVDLTPPREDEV